MKSTIELIKEKGILVASHRGTSGANIPCNTIAAFDIALKEGADIIELDLFSSKDGEIFVFHTGMEPAHIDRHLNIETLTSEEIRKLKLSNSDLVETPIGLNTLDEVLEHYKNRCILNLDRCIHIIKDVVVQVERHNMRNQILLKSDTSLKSLELIEGYASKYDYMPIFMDEDNATNQIKNMNINYIGAELVFKSDKSPIAQDAYIECMKKQGKVLWANSIVYSSKVPLAGGHSDDISLMDDPAKGWGWLVDKGFDIIQTDWTHHLVHYLKNYK